MCIALDLYTLVKYASLKHYILLNAPNLWQNLQSVVCACV